MILGARLDAQKIHVSSCRNAAKFTRQRVSFPLYQFCPQAAEGCLCILFFFIICIGIGRQRLRELGVYRHEQQRQGGEPLLAVHDFVNKLAARRRIRTILTQMSEPMK
jgi:hypothetical protein